MESTRSKELAVAAMGGVAVVSAVLAGSIVWLLMTQPSAVVTAVGDHGVAQALFAVVRTVLATLIRYL
jgi:hypothetical protein